LTRLLEIWETFPHSKAHLCRSTLDNTQALKVFQACEDKELPTNQLQILANIEATFVGMPDLLYHALKKNIVRDGMRDPLLVMHDEKTVVGGKHRLRIAQELGWKTVECHVLPEIVDERDAYELGVLDNALRRRLSSWEMAILIDALWELHAKPRGRPRKAAGKRLDYGQTRDVVAALLGISKDKVDYYHSISKLPQPIWPDIIAGRVSEANLKMLVEVARDGHKQVVAGLLTQQEYENAIISTVRELIEYSYDTTWLVFKLSKRMKVVEQSKARISIARKTQNKWLKLMRGNRALERFISQPEALKNAMSVEDIEQMVEELKFWSAGYLELAVNLESLYDN